MHHAAFILHQVSERLSGLRNQLLVSSDALKAQLETSEQGLRESLQQLKAFLDELQAGSSFKDI